MPKQIPNCEFDGIAYIGCTNEQCKSWVRSEGRTVLAHELGHNFGLQHAGTDSDNDGAKDLGILGEYGDSSGIMGNSGAWRLFNAPHRASLGWLAAASTFSVESSCDAKQSFELATLSASVQAAVTTLKVPRAGGGSYWVSVRTSIGHDEQMDEGFINRVHVHYEEGGVDSGRGSRYVIGLGQKGFFSDGAYLQINVISLDRNGAVVALCENGPEAGASEGEVKCEDTGEDCTGWALAGFCISKSYLPYMTANCRVACGICNSTATTTAATLAPCTDNVPSCQPWAGLGYCNKKSIYSKYMQHNCKSSCAACDDIYPTQSAPRPPSTTLLPMHTCKDSHPNCGFWGKTDVCLNPSHVRFMTRMCSRTCGACTNSGVVPTKPRVAHTATTTSPAAVPTPKSSTKSCTDLGWKLRFGNSKVCGESNDGLGSCAESDTVHSDAALYCERAGSRLCTMNELNLDAARGTGCDLDSNYVWTADECYVDGSPEVGRWMSSGSSVPTGGSSKKPLCSSVFASKARVRCCADVIRSDPNNDSFATPLHQPSVVSIWDDSYGDVHAGEREFVEPPAVSTTKSAPTMGYSTSSNMFPLDTTVDFEEVGVETRGSAAATVLAVVAVVVVFIGAVYWRNRNAEVSADEGKWDGDISVNMDTGDIGIHPRHRRAAVCPTSPTSEGRFDLGSDRQDRDRAQSVT